MPIGYLITVVLMALAMLLALVPLGRPAALRTASWTLGSIVNESPFVAFYWILAATLLALAQGDLDTPVGWVALAIAGVTFLGTPVLVRRSLAARPAVEAALADGLGPRWRDAIEPPLAGRLRSGKLPWLRILLAPLPFLHRGVRQKRNLSYGDGGRRNRLDVYFHPARPAGAPILIHFHGGGFFMGRKSFYSRALLVELARHGWVCFSANYRLRPRAVFPDYVVDAKKAIVWAREHAAEYGADPSVVFVAGSSAGAHMAATAALTPNDSRFQPGFEEADTNVAGAICLFGYYGPVDRGRQPLPSSPLDYPGPTRRRSSSRTANGTCSSPSSRHACSPSGCGTSRRAQSCTPSSRRARTTSTCSIPFASRSSSTGSRRSPPGCVRRTYRALGSRLDVPRAERLGHGQVRAARPDQSRGRRVDLVRPRECEQEPGERRTAPADRRPASVRAERHLDG
jgi:hypothetical protein